MSRVLSVLHTSGTCGYTPGVDLDELIAELKKLRGLRGVERAAVGRPLVAVARESIAAAADEGVVQALEVETYQQVASRLGVSINAVRAAKRDHSRRAAEAVALAESMSLATANRASRGKRRT